MGNTTPSYLFVSIIPPSFHHHHHPSHSCYLQSNHLVSFHHDHYVLNNNTVRMNIFVHISTIHSIHLHHHPSHNPQIP
jgi:hypothetical protein